MNETALITGASSGIGKEMALELAKMGKNLVLVARSKDVLEKLKMEIENNYSVNVWIFSQDLSLSDSAENVYNFTQSSKLEIDYLINNAGFGDYGFFHESQWEKQEEMIRLNILTLTKLTHVYVKEMLKRKKGKILQVASVAAFQPGPLMSVYYATKAYVLHFSEAINNEIKNSGVTVTTLCPGPTESGFQKAAAMENSKLMKSVKMQDSRTVALYGIKAMMKGKTIAVPGLENKFMTTLVPFFPRSWVVRIVRLIQDKRA